MTTKEQPIPLNEPMPHRKVIREWLIPLLRERLRVHTSKHLSEVFEKNALPYAPITPPHELLDDEHL